MTHDELMRGYLKRLGLQIPPAPDLAGLRQLVIRHLQAIPFENLDVMAGLRGDLTTRSAVHKVVIRRRGGFCYELNEACGELLRHVGFEVRRIEARVWVPPRQAFGAPFDHLALLVRLPEGEYLVDVGFGDNNRSPLRLPQDATTDVSGTYTLRQVSAALWLLARPDRPLYELTLATQPLEAFAAMHRHHQTSPESMFCKGLICTRATADGRITLSGERLIVTAGEQRTESVVADRERALEQYFGIVCKEAPC